MKMHRIFSLQRYETCCWSLLCSYRKLSSTLSNHQKSNYGITSGRTGGEEKWAQVAMEYIYELNRPSEAGKRHSDVEWERRLSTCFDRFLRINEKTMEKRMNRLVQRMNESIEKLKQFGMAETVEEATMLNTDQPPLNFRRPSLTPPLPGYEPGFGMDVPQLKAQQMEYPPVRRLTDDIEFSGSSASLFPFVEQHEIDALTHTTLSNIDRESGELCEKAPTTGVEGEAWAARVALERKALARQKLILDLVGNPLFQEQYNNNDAFRFQEWRKRGMAPLDIEPERECHESVHFAHEPSYQPFRDTISK